MDGWMEASQHSLLLLLSGPPNCKTTYAPRGDKESLQQSSPSKIILAHIPALDTLLASWPVSSCL